MSTSYLGIDIAKEKFDAALLKDERQHAKTFKNSLAGYNSLCKWLRKHNVTEFHACMEATGAYWEELAEYLHGKGFKISVVNPVCIKSFRSAELTRTKTDPVDALTIATYCKKMNPAEWTPPVAELKELQAMVRRLDALKDMHTQEANRLAVPNQPETVMLNIEALLSFIEKQIEQLEKEISDHIDRYPDMKKENDLLKSITGIGKTSSIQVLSEMADVHKYSSARQLAAQSGLTPREHRSGSSVYGKPRISKIGNSRLRRALYFPAIVAKKHNPIIREFCKRLEAAGKPKMVVIAAAMRKLLHIIYGVLKSGKPFDPDYSPNWA